MLVHLAQNNQIQRILIVKFGTVCDIVQILPLINLLKTRFPYAKVACLASPEMVDFLNSYNIVDHIILAKPMWYKMLRERKTLRTRLKNFAPDVCIDFEDNFASRLAAKFSGAVRQLTDRLTDRGNKNRILRKANTLKKNSSRLQYRLELLKPLGLLQDASFTDRPNVDYALPRNAAESRTVDWIVHELGLYSTPFAIVNVAVKSDSSHWETDRYAQVARYLSHELDYPTVIAWQNVQEKRLAEKIVVESGDRVVIAPAVSAVQFAAFARCAAICVGADNDFLHIAAATGTPTVGILSDTESQFNAPVCDNFQWVMAQPVERRRKRCNNVTGTPLPQIDNYTYDVIKVCHACGKILLPAEEILASEQMSPIVVGV